MTSKNDECHPVAGLTLSLIFDFSENGNMPMNNSTGRYTIIYNGEIEPK